MKKILLTLTAVFTAVLFVAPRAAAQADDTTIEDFHARYELFNDAHAGRMQVTETFRMRFTNNVEKHGPLRAIPLKYKGNSLRLDVQFVKRDGQDEDFTTYRENDNEVLKIGRADVLVTGQTHTYEIKYEMKNIISFFGEYDEWYWDINGDQWTHPFMKVSGEVVMPEGWSTDNIPAASCFTGKFGRTTSACSITRSPTGYAFASFDRLEPSETLTVATPFQKGLFAPRDRTDWFRDNAWQLVGLATGAALGFVAFRQWRRWGKDYKGRGTIVPEYKAPKNLTPAEVGLLNDYSVDSRDLTATLIDLAIRGYLKINDEEKKTLGIFKSREFTLELTNDRIGNLKSHEKKLLNALFKSVELGAKQKVKDIDKTKMYKTVTEIRKDLKTSLTKEHGLFDEAPTRAHVVTWGVASVAIALIFITTPGWGWIAGLAGAGLSGIVFGLLMRRRTHAGVKAYEHIKGLQMYMDTAEKDRLKMMESVDRPYAEPAHTVEFFEKLLPFAVALGVEKSWAKQFENIYREPPGWYSGNYATFNAVYFTNSLASGVSSFNSSFSTSTSSSSSGSGGGGFAGGGGGGGGGGSW